MPTDSSRMFGSNIVNLLKLMIGKDGEFNFNLQDEIIYGTTAVHNREYVSEKAKQLTGIK
jgi:NAD/NADP transhydrogenase alpha subunit